MTYLFRDIRFIRNRTNDFFYKGAGTEAKECCPAVLEPISIAGMI